MSGRLLIIDSSYLCHRAFHTMRDLSFGGRATGVIYGFLRSIIDLKQEFCTDRIAFCFDAKTSLRKDIYPDYKKRREIPDQREVQARSELGRQIDRLRLEYLPEIGFQNVFYEEGYESDDLMASLAGAESMSGKVIIVTADQDLLQCLRENIVIYSPQLQKVLTERWFKKTYGIRPSSWVLVKALAGCKSDNVKGLWHVGDMTALKYLRGELDENSEIYKLIVGAEGRRVLRQNRRLVELPFKFCPVPKLQPDKITPAGWKSVCDKLGMKSLAGRIPIYNR